jgi:hypothetical protein
MSDALLVITCVSDLEGFAQEVYDHLYSALEKQRQFEDGRSLQVDRDLVTMTGNEIQVDGRTNAPAGMVKWVLESFLKENKDRFKDYTVIEFGDALTIGKVLPPSKMDLSTCEICGFFTPYSEELQTHRMTHFGL